MYKFEKSQLDALYQKVDSRKAKQNFEILAEVSKIVGNVIANGDDALKAYSLEFDRCAVDTLQIPFSTIEEAYKTSDPKFIEAILYAKKNIEKFHSKQVLEGYEISGQNKLMGQLIRPLDRVGIYVPGGEASYPSTLLMNAIPARIAGVKEIVVVTPPQEDASHLKPILCTLYILGITEVYQVGGAQAVAALAYGTQTIKRVDKITGPGNQYVTAAKKLVFGDVAIDMIAGPSEILVLSDGSGDPSFIAADLLSQLEHDTEAMAVLVTTSRSEFDQIESVMADQIAKLSRKRILSKSFEDNTFAILVDSLEEAIDVANDIAPEHLELMIKEPLQYLDQINHAGVVFLGENTPESVGDYTAGPNHTLPTTGSARFSSPLGTYDFQKRMNYIYYEKEALLEDSESILIFSKEERLDAHGMAVKVRL